MSNYTDVILLNSYCKRVQKYLLKKYGYCLKRLCTLKNDHQICWGEYFNYFDKEEFINVVDKLHNQKSKSDWIYNNLGGYIQILIKNENDIKYELFNIECRQYKYVRDITKEDWYKREAAVKQFDFNII